jgi:two-component system, OmpR family, KDP operon response regulator KdpE
MQTSVGALHTVLFMGADSPARRAVCASLVHEGYRLIEAGSSSEALALASARPPDLVIIDMDTAGAGSPALVGQIRKRLPAPVIVMSQSADDASKLAAFDAGADDYLTKPIVMPELLARLRVAVRRMSQNSTHMPSGTVVAVGELVINRASRQVFLGDKEIKLTPIEWRLLDALAAQAGKPLSHSFLLNEVWGPESIDDVQYLRVFIAGLRRKLEVNPHRPRYIVTEQGLGYRLSSNQQVE